MDDNDDDYFSDDGFDSLPPGTLLKLEQDAIARRAAQQPASEASNVARNPNVPSRQRDVAGQSVYGNPTLTLPSHLHTGLTSEYGTLEVGEPDAEVLDGDDQSVIALDQRPAAFADRPPAQQYHPTEGIQFDRNRSVELQKDWEQPVDNVDIMEVDEAYMGHAEDYSHDSYGKIQELAARIEEVSWEMVVFLFLRRPDTN